MKKVNALVLGLAVLLAFGCGGNEPQPEIDPGITPAASGCQILMDSSVSDGVNRYTYNAQGKVTRIDRRNNFQGSIYETFSYDAEGKINQVNTHSLDGALVSYVVYQRNINGQIIRQTGFGRNTPASPLEEQGHQRITYGPDGKITERKNFASATAVFPHRIFQYVHQANGLIVEKDFSDPAYSGNPQLQGIVEYQYDNMKNPLVGMESIVTQLVFPTEHNLISAKYYTASYNFKYEFAYTFQYNAKGYPVKRNRINTAYAQEDIFHYHCQ